MGQIIDLNPLGSAGGDPSDILLLDLLSNNSVGPVQPSDQSPAHQKRADLSDALKATGDQRAVKKLRRCGTASIPVETPDGIRWVRKGCHAAYCPVCNARKASRLLHAMSPMALAIMGARGGYLHLVLAGPDREGSDELPPLRERLRALLSVVRKALAGYRWKTSFSTSLGLVFFAELSRGGHGQGHPHIHLFACAGSLRALETFTNWLSDRWQDLVPGALPLRIHQLARAGSSRDWSRSLRYALKGSNPAPDWGADLLLEAVGALSSNMRLMSAQGLLKGNWLGPKSKESQAA